MSIIGFHKQKNIVKDIKLNIITIKDIVKDIKRNIEAVNGQKNIN